MPAPETAPAPAAAPPSTADARRARADDADALLSGLFADASEGDPTGLAVVAVGGYGRRELSPRSDLDVVLLHAADVPAERVAAVAERLWYPLWDRGVALDHAVRDVDSMRTTAREDHRAAMGMLDARPVAGDGGLVLALRSEVLADWRRDARERVAQVRTGREQRIERAGWVAHAAVPDLKESGGGLRDGVVLRALVATWLVDVPHVDVEHLRSALLDVRDLLHEVSSRRTDRLTPEVVADAAAAIDVDPAALDLHVRHLGRSLAHLSGLTWGRIDAILRPQQRSVRRRTPPVVTPLGDGVGRLGDEVVLAPGADPDRDPVLALRLAARAARDGLPLAPGTARRLAAGRAELPEPWPATATRALVDLLTAGPGLVPVWEELDIAGVVDRWLPEWADVRLRGSSSPVHRYTVDRHSLETCVVASSLRRDVDRPDLLAVAALLHDIGKGRAGDHSEVGAPMAVEIARRWGFGDLDADVVGRLVLWHLLLPTVATRRDIEDPATAANVAEVVGGGAFLDLLVSLTEADARSTGASAWSGWRRGLVTGLVEKVRDQLAGVEPPAADEYEGWPTDVPRPDVDAGPLGPTDVTLAVEEHHDGSLLTVVTADRPGLMARIAGSFALQGLGVRSVRLVTDQDVALSLWEVGRSGVDATVARERLAAVLAGTIDLEARMVLKPVEGVPSRVTLLHDRSETATLLEVRAADRRGLVWTVCDVIAGEGHSIRSGHLSTYGDEARDVFYVVDEAGGPLAPERAEALRAAVATRLDRAD